MNVIYLNTANSKNRNRFVASTSDQTRNYKADKLSISRYNLSVLWERENGKP